MKKGPGKHMDAQPDWRAQDRDGSPQFLYYILSSEKGKLLNDNVSMLIRRRPREVRHATLD